MCEACKKIFDDAEKLGEYLMRQTATFFGHETQEFPEGEGATYDNAEVSTIVLAMFATGLSVARQSGGDPVKTAALFADLFFETFGEGAAALLVQDLMARSAPTPKVPKHLLN